MPLFLLPHSHLGSCSYSTGYRTTKQRTGSEPTSNARRYLAAGKGLVWSLFPSKAGEGFEDTCPWRLARDPAGLIGLRRAAMKWAQERCEASSGMTEGRCGALGLEELYLSVDYLEI